MTYVAAVRGGVPNDLIREIGEAGDAAARAITWELHKPRVWRARTQYVMATLVPHGWPHAGRRPKEWVVTVDVISGPRRREAGRVRRRKRADAKRLAEVVMKCLHEQVEWERARRKGS